MSRLSLSNRLQIAASYGDPQPPSIPQPRVPPETYEVLPAQQPRADSPLLSGWSSERDSGGGNSEKEEHERENWSEEEEVEGEDEDDDFAAFDGRKASSELYDDDDDEKEDFVNENDADIGKWRPSENILEEVIDLCTCPNTTTTAPTATVVVQQQQPEVELNKVVEQKPVRCCQVCGMELSSLHYLHQVQHVKQCLSKRHLQGDGAAALPIAAAAPLPPPRTLLDMDIGTWLKEIELDSFTHAFIAEEVDMSLVHALDEEDLRTLGIIDISTQLRFLRAAKKVGEEINAKKRAKNKAAAANKNNALHAPAKRKKKQQQTLKDVVLGALKKQDPDRTLDDGGNREKMRSAEQALLSSLYPPLKKIKTALVPLQQQQRDTGQQHQLVENVVEEEEDDDDDNGGVQPTPPLPVAIALASSRVDPATSLFTCAARCEQVTEPLEVRIEKKRAAAVAAADLNRRGGDGGVPGGGGRVVVIEPLARGGVVFHHRVEEHRTIKVMKLDALRDELRAHEDTVSELKRLIGELETELGLSSNSNGGGNNKL